MLEAQPITADRAVTQEQKKRFGLPWSYDEIDRLRDFAKTTARGRDLAQAFPDRSLKSVKHKLSQIRFEMKCSRHRDSSNLRGSKGVFARMLDPDDEGHETQEETRWRERAREANILFLETLGDRRYG